MIDAPVLPKAEQFKSKTTDSSKRPEALIKIDDQLTKVLELQSKEGTNLEAIIEELYTLRKLLGDIDIEVRKKYAENINSLESKVKLLIDLHQLGDNREELEDILYRQVDDYYGILGVLRTASRKEIKKAYDSKKKALKNVDTKSKEVKTKKRISFLLENAHEGLSNNTAYRVSANEEVSKKENYDKWTNMKIEEYGLTEAEIMEIYHEEKISSLETQNEIQRTQNRISELLAGRLPKEAETRMEGYDLYVTVKNKDDMAATRSLLVDLFGNRPSFMEIFGIEQRFPFVFEVKHVNKELEKNTNIKRVREVLNYHGDDYYGIFGLSNYAKTHDDASNKIEDIYKGMISVLDEAIGDTGKLALVKMVLDRAKRLSKTPDKSKTKKQEMEFYAKHSTTMREQLKEILPVEDIMMDDEGLHIIIKNNDDAIMEKFMLDDDESPHTINENDDVMEGNKSDLRKIFKIAGNIDSKEIKSKNLRIISIKNTDVEDLKNSIEDYYYETLDKIKDYLKAELETQLPGDFHLSILSNGELSYLQLGQKDEKETNFKEAELFLKKFLPKDTKFDHTEGSTSLKTNVNLGEFKDRAIEYYSRKKELESREDISDIEKSYLEFPSVSEFRKDTKRSMWHLRSKSLRNLENKLKEVLKFKEKGLHNRGGDLGELNRLIELALKDPNININRKSGIRKLQTKVNKLIEVYKSMPSVEGQGALWVNP